MTADLTEAHVSGFPSSLPASQCKLEVVSADCYCFVPFYLFDWFFIYVHLVPPPPAISEQHWDRYPCVLISKLICEYIGKINSLINLLNEYLSRPFFVPSTFLGAKNATNSLKSKLLSQSIYIFNFDRYYQTVFPQKPHILPKPFFFCTHSSDLVLVPYSSAKIIKYRFYHCQSGR